MALPSSELPPALDKTSEYPGWEEKPQNLPDKKDQGGKHSDYVWTVFKSILGTLNHLMIGGITFVSCWFPLRTYQAGDVLSTTNLHILLCSIGYQFMMAEAILAFTPHAGWSLPLKPSHKRHAHWVMQVLGSLLAISGTIVQIWARRGQNFGSTHGITGLVAMLLNGVSLFNGIAAFYSTKFRNLIKPKYSKILHIFTGASAFVLGVVCHCYGYDKNMFRGWAGDGFTTAIIAINGINVALVISSPFMSVAKKLSF